MTSLVRGEVKSSSSLHARELDDPAPHPLQQDLHVDLAIQAIGHNILSPWSDIFHQRKAYKHWIKQNMNVLTFHEVSKQVVRMTRHVSCQNRFTLTACPEG